MSKDFKKPTFNPKRFERLKVAISQIEPMDMAFAPMVVNEYELLVMTIYKLNDLIKVTNSYTELINEILEWVLNEGLQQAVLDQLNVWLNDGTLEVLINETLFNMKLDKTEFEEYKTIVNQTLLDLEQNIQSIIDDEISRIDGEIIRIDVELEDLETNKANKDYVDNELETKVNQEYLDSYFVSVKKYGAVGDGVTDDTIAIQTCINENDNVYFPNGHYIITKPLLIDRSRITLKGSNVANSFTSGVRIQKIGVQKHSGLGHDSRFTSVNYDDIDAVIMTINYIGDFTISKISFVGSTTDGVKTQYGLFFAHTYRYRLDDIYVDDCDYLVRNYQTWNTSFNKVRLRNGLYGFYIGLLGELPQSTSIEFNQTFVESCAVAYRLINLTYFSGSSVSSDFIKDVAHWYQFSSGGFNGVGNEYSEGQLIRCWMSTVTWNGVFVLAMKRHTGIIGESKSKAKIEIWSENRNNTGMVINDIEFRNASGSGNNDGVYVGGASKLILNVPRMDYLYSNSDNPRIVDSGSSLFINHARGVSQMGGNYTIGNQILKPTSIGYNVNGTDKLFDKFVRYYMINTVVPSITLSINDIRDVFPYFGHSDNFLRRAFKITVVSGNSMVTDIYLIGGSLNTSNKIKIGNGIDISSVEINGNDFVINFDESRNYFIIKIEEM